MNDKRNALEEYEYKWGAVKTILEENRSSLRDVSDGLQLIDDKFHNTTVLFDEIFDAQMKEKSSDENKIDDSPSILFGELVNIPAFMMSKISDTVFENLLLKSMESYAPDAQAAFELGSGWGRRLLRMVMRTRGRGINYHALDFSPNGLSVIEELARYEPKETIQTHKFDFYNPFDTEIASGKKDSIFVYTANAIEQVKQLDRSVIDFILSLGEKVVCAHLEPIGWQFDEPVSPLDQPLKEYCARCEYNQNFRDIYDQYIADGTIKEKARVKDVWSNADPRIARFGGSAVSLIVWEKA